ncbi:MAG: hypothetical protein FWE22_02195 [Firmicutes bacterium]|nr:hypothetical protein [Bacillota bacterium]
MPLRDKVKKTFKEVGMVLYREARKATDSFTSSDGSTIPATDDRWIVGVICSEEFSLKEGFVSRVTVECKVSETEFQKYEFGSKVQVKFEFTERGSKPVLIDGTKLHEIEHLGKFVEVIKK